MLLLQVEEGINIIVGLVLFRVRVELPVQCGARRAHNVHTPCTHRVRVALTCLFAGALQVRQGRAQKVSPAANVFSR